jgi:hypothetical protein
MKRSVHTRRPASGEAIEVTSRHTNFITNKKFEVTGSQYMGWSRKRPNLEGGITYIRTSEVEMATPWLTDA